MRISDWSSDVCSSDLHVQDDELRVDDLVEQADRLLAIARTHHREPRRLQHVGVHAPELVVVFGQDNRSDGHRNLNGGGPAACEVTVLKCYNRVNFWFQLTEEHSVLLLAAEV